MPRTYPFDHVWYARRYLTGTECEELCRADYAQNSVQNSPKPAGHELNGRFSCYEEEAEAYRKRSQAVLGRQICQLESLACEIARYQDARSHLSRDARSQVVVFSALSGKYDSLKIPGYLDPHFAYVLFSDSPEVESGVWEIRTLPCFNRDLVRRTRYVKLHPHRLFSSARIAVWVDQNVLILDDLSEEISAFSASGLPLATFYHPTRENVGEEALTCLSLNKDDAETLKKQIHDYQKLGALSLPLANTNIVFYNLAHPELGKVMTVWWRELERYSRRDQLSCTLALTENRTAFFPLAKKGISPANHPKFGVLNHDKNLGLASLVASALSSHLIDPLAGRCRLEAAEQAHAPLTLALPLGGGEVGVLLKILSEQLRSCDTLCLLETGAGPAFPLNSLNTSAHLTTLSLAGENDLVPAFNSLFQSAENDHLLLLPKALIISDAFLKKITSALTLPGAGLSGVLSNVTCHTAFPLPGDVTKSALEGTLGDPDCASGDLQRSGAFAGAEVSLVNHLLAVWAQGLCLRLPLLESVCLCLRRSVCAGLGGFDPVFARDPAAAFLDMSLRAQDQGIESVLAADTFVAAEGRFAPHPSNAAILEERFGQERLERGYKSLLYHPILSALRKKAQCYA